MMPNRDQRRKTQRRAKIQGRKTFTLLELQKSFSIALEMKEASLGHLFSKNLKEHCVFCGEDRTAKDECEYWFLTYLDRVQTILLNPEFFTDKDIEAIWLQHAAEYAQIKIPVKNG